MENSQIKGNLLRQRGPGSDTADDYRLPAISVLSVGFDSFHQKCGESRNFGQVSK